MSELAPYEDRQRSPLTAGARFLRGFKRIGLVVAALSIAIGTILTIIIAIDAQRSAERRHEAAACIAKLMRDRTPLKMKEYSRSEIDFEANGCPYMWSMDIDSIKKVAAEKPGPLQCVVEPAGIGVILTFGVASILYFGFWLIGWVCAGFTRD